VAPCPACGEQNSEVAKRCVACGFPLSGDHQHDEIRRIVTIVTSDLKGSTSLGERLDPESLREVLTRYFDEMRAVIEAHGGTIEKIIGDAIVAVFGLPTRRDDDPIRAVTAAAATQAALAELNESLQATWGVQLTTRTGVATGQVVVGAAAEGQHVLTGPALALATAMEQNAPAMDVLVHESTADLLVDSIDVEPVEQFVPKGMDREVVAYRLLGVRRQADAGQSARTCPACGTTNPAELRICRNCDAELSWTSATRESRKTVTIVFADPKPSAVGGGAPTPEALRDVMSSYFEAMRDILQRHSGTVETFIGDAVMAVFGLPVRHEDDALRATRAANEMQAVMPALNARFEKDSGVTLRNHIGVNTGEVVAGDASLGQRLVTGDAVNVAARLEQAAKPLEILMGDLTYQLVSNAVDAESVEPLTLKGKAEPVPAYRLVAMRSSRDSARPQDAPMVGRAAELEQLTETLNHVVDESAPRTVTIIGDAGVGKTRLTRAFLDVAETQGTVLRGRCLPYGDGITFWPLIEIVREAVGIRDDDPPDVAMDRLLGSVGGDREVADRIGSVVGLAATSYQVAELFWAVRRFFEHAAADRPITILVDDIHWAEPTFLDLIEHLTDGSSNTAMLVLCTARGELLEKREGWGDGERSATIILRPLSEADAGKVIENLLGDAGLAEDARTRIVAASEGNPLFVEQLLSMLIDGGRLQRTDRGWVATSDLSALAIPPTIHALLAARLDALPSDERAVVEPASVIGLVFALRAVEELAPSAIREDVPSHMASLSHRELVHQEAAAFEDDQTYRFHHLLIRDAAYQGLLKRSRADLHERFVAWADIVNAERGRATEFEEILGYHLEQAYRYRAELGPLDARGVALGERAAERLGSAGGRALERGDLPAAASLLGRAAAVLGADHPTRPWLLIRAGEARLELGEFENASGLLDEAKSTAARIGDAALEATARIERSRIRYRTDAAGVGSDFAAQLDHDVQILEAAGADAGLARAARLRFEIEGAAAQWGAAEQTVTAMLRYAQASGDRLMEIRGLPALAMAARFGPLPVSEAIARCGELLDRARGNRRAEAGIRRVIAQLRAMEGDFETARDIYRDVRRTLLELGWNFNAALVSIASGPIELLAGDPVAAERELRQDFDTLTQMGEKNYIGTIAAYLAEALYRQDRVEEAMVFAEFSQATSAEDDLAGQYLWRQVQAKVLARRGNVDAGTRLATEAVALTRQSDDPTDQANALVDLAEIHQLAGRGEDALDALRQALDRHQAKGNIPAARSVQAQILALSNDESIASAAAAMASPAGKR
jgi:class 3 adenylate cyclase